MPVAEKIFNNQDYFQSVFKTYYAPLCNYVNQHIRNWENSREVVQNTFLKIWDNRKSIRVTTSVQSYLYQAVKNTMIDHIRKDKTYRDYTGNEELVIHKLYQEKADELKPFIIRKHILKAMEKLKPKNRKIFELHKLEGLTYKEIATHLDISERSVEDNIARALRLLREELKDKVDLIY